MEWFEPCMSMDWPQEYSMIHQRNWNEQLCLMESSQSEFYNLPLSVACRIEPLTIQCSLEDNEQKSWPSSTSQVEKDEHPIIQSPEQSKSKAKMSRSKVGCNCKKSQCLKSYCECYSSRSFCSQGCHCENCRNTILNIKWVQLTRTKQQGKLIKNGTHCQCKKSKCLKKYCNCYEIGMICGIYCKCQGCQNSSKC